MKESWCYYDLKVSQYRAWKEAHLHNAAYLHIPFTTSCSNAASVHFWVMHFFRATLMLHEFENIICSKVSLFRLLNVQLYIHTSTNTNTKHISKYKYTGLWNAWPAAAAHCVAIWTPPPHHPTTPTSLIMLCRTLSNQDGVSSKRHFDHDHYHRHGWSSHLDTRPWETPRLGGSRFQLIFSILSSKTSEAMILKAQQPYKNIMIIIINTINIIFIIDWPSLDTQNAKALRPLVFGPSPFQFHHILFPKFWIWMNDDGISHWDAGD